MKKPHRGISRANCITCSACASHGKVLYFTASRQLFHGPGQTFCLALRGGYHYANGVFRCGQCNIILALTDIGPGDGPTMVIPGSHKSNFPHPQAGDYVRGDAMDMLPGAIPVYLKAGDAVLFVDGLMHGGSSRTNKIGERRVTIYRYGPLWASTRFGFEYSQSLLQRLTPTRRKILQPVEPVRPPKS